MYVRTTTRSYKGTTYVNYLLVESVSTPKGPRQRTICSLGNLSPRPAAEWLKLAQKVEDALVGQLTFEQEHTDPEVQEIVRRVQARQKRVRPPATTSAPDTAPADDLVTVHADQVRTQQAREAGPVQVAYSFWQRLGLDDILRRQGFSERAVRLTCAMTLARLIHPSSEHAMPNWIDRTALADLLGEDLTGLGVSSLYRNLDRLHDQRAAIEAALVAAEQTLFNVDRMVLFYDLTSTYFEGLAKKNPKAKRGYSRDKRSDCVQVVVGLVVNRDGFPMAHEIFEGNTQDRKSLAAMLDVLEQRAGPLQGRTIVIDRGMAFEENLEQLRARQMHYIVASRQSERLTWLAELEDAAGFTEIIRQPSPRNPGQKKSRVVVKQGLRDETKYVLCISDGRKAKDRAIREKQEGRLLADVAKLTQRVAEGALVKPEKIGEAIGRIKERYPRVARYYTLQYQALTKQVECLRNDDKRTVAEQLDGSYVLETDRLDLDLETAWRTYILLTRAEDAFRDMKSVLQTRPNFHQVERRVDTHIFLCMLAYHLLVAIEKTLLDQGIHTSWATIREALASHQLSTIVLPASNGWELHIRRSTVPEPEQQELYDLLGVSAELIKPKKTWVAPVGGAEHSD